MIKFKKIDAFIHLNTGKQQQIKAYHLSGEAVPEYADLIVHREGSGWRVTERSTGCGIPQTRADTREKAAQAGITAVELLGEAKYVAGLQKMREHLKKI